MVLRMFWVIFGILGVQLWKGQFYYCTDDSVTYRDQCVSESTDLKNCSPASESSATSSTRPSPHEAGATHRPATPRRSQHRARTAEALR